jgi:serine/threonine protein kinase
LEEDGTYSLAMEYLDGQSLSAVFKRLGRKAVPLEEHLFLLSQVLSGLQYVHSLTDYAGNTLQLVHRDVCPANVFVTYDGDVKLLDFGIAKAMGAAAITKPGTFKGRLGYCAPEQIMGGPLDGRADIFAVGVMLWEALAGRRLSSGGSTDAVIEARLSGLDVQKGDLRPELTPELADICDRALALEPDARYASAADFLRDIEAYLDKRSRQVGRAQLAALLQAHFAKDRKAVREQVEAQLSMPFEEATGIADLRSDDVATAILSTPIPATPSERPVHSRSRQFSWTWVAAAVVVSIPAAWYLHRSSAGSATLVSLSAPVLIDGTQDAQNSDTEHAKRPPIVESLASDMVEAKAVEFVLPMKALRLREPLAEAPQPTVQSRERPASGAAPKLASKRDLHERSRRSRLTMPHPRRPAVGVASEGRRRPQVSTFHEARKTATEPAEPGAALTRSAPTEQQAHIDERDPYE